MWHRENRYGLSLNRIINNFQNKKAVFRTVYKFVKENYLTFHEYRSLSHGESNEKGPTDSLIDIYEYIDEIKTITGIILISLKK